MRISRSVLREAGGEIPRPTLPTEMEALELERTASVARYTYNWLRPEKLLELATPYKLPALAKLRLPSSRSPARSAC